LVAFLLGLSTVDPLRHGLCFERFVHPERRDLPDIDLDLASDRRDEVIDWVFRRFGAERVAMVAAHQTFGRRAAYREGLKALGMSLAEVNRFCAQIPEELEAGAIALPPLPPQFRNAAPLLERLIGRPQHLSVHPGGVVLAEPRIECYAPLERAPKGVPVTQYDMTSLEKLGLIKLDLLGNRALAAMQEAERWIHRQRSTVNGQPEMPGAQIASRPSASRNDQATLALLRAGNTVGCFQIETPAMRSLLRKLPVRGIEDLIATLALVRPGPASGEAKAAYIRRAHGEEPATPPHPRLAERLSSNYGMLLFEEDLMAAIAQLTGWPLAQADEFRAALIAADPGSSTLAELERRFVTGSASTGVSGADALRVWRILERFAAYSFNKAHAASYAQLAWQAAFLKAHHPLELACGVLNSYGGQYPLRTVAADFARCGVRLLAPHVNRSETPSVLESGALRLGLGGVKFLTGRNRERIRELRPFADLADLLHKVPLPYRELEALVLSGACDGLAPLAAAAYPFPHEDFLARWQRQPGAAALDGFVLRTPAGAQGATYRALVRCRNELGFLGMHPSEHPLRVLREEARRQGCLTTAELPAYRGETIRLAALVAATRRLAAARGRGIMQFVTLEDEHGLLEAVLRPGVYASLGDPVTNPGPLLIGGKVEADHGDFQLVVTEVTPFHSRPAPYGEFAKL
ncbi:MAG TPA: hypothetical protein VGQ73_05320, partial [Gemmatimonadales bacterium]|nr:hypothetical protein [Gemmatimonadales bacterium]